MHPHYLEKLFSPTSIAIIGASERPNSVGTKVFKNLLQANFKGRLYAVNPKHKLVQGKRCVSSVKKINGTIDLAIIATPAKAVPNIMTECGQKGIRAVIVLSSGFSEMGDEGKALEKKLLTIAKQFQIRIIGPNCLGVMRPEVNLNATFDNNFPAPGSIALVSQSGAISASILDWAMNRKIGFSAIISFGDSADLDFGDLLDYLALDPHTKSILLYIEGVKKPRHFMSALRAAARIKPVIAIKAGKNSVGSHAAISHTGALVGNDAVFDAALRRSGVVRVFKIEDLFTAAEMLANPKKLSGNRLMVITNGGGAGVMAADHAAELDVELPSLSDKLIARLSQFLPKQWSHQNPIDIIGDATPERYHEVLNICEKEPEIDGILTILVPVSMAHPFKVAKQIIHDAKKCNKVILACWLGEKHVKTSWKLFAKYKIPYFDTPEKAVEAFSYLADYYRNQKLLMQVPLPYAHQFKPDVTKARAKIEAILQQGRTILTAHESKEILHLFGIPVVESIEADSVEKAIDAAKTVGFPVVMKINSPSITHKSAAGGVSLNLKTEEDVRAAFKTMLEKATNMFPQHKILGVTIERQYQNEFDREIMIGVIRDIVFGPVISFGAGGTLVEIIQDTALALPPLNHFIAQQLIKKTRVLKLGGKLTQINREQLENIITILLCVSTLVCELPYIQEMDINPFILNETGMIAVDARIIVSQVDTTVLYSHLAIHPYPNDLISTHELANKTILTIRPICPEDAALEQAFIRNLSPKTKYLRFMRNFIELSPSMLVKFTQIDYDREMALVAIHQEAIIGVARYVINADWETAEFALVVADGWQGKGVGTVLMEKLIDVAKSKHIKALNGMVFSNNVDMLNLVRHLGFQISSSEDPEVKMVIKQL